MGCITSKTIITENSNRFDVIFADTEQTIYYNAQLEINGSDIVLYRKNKPPLSWPLGSLRRYGFDATYFTFESGRRCETGEGIFSFKCKRADVLFNTLQSYINGRAYNTEDVVLHSMNPNASNRSIAQLNSLNLNGTLHTSTQGSSYVVNARPNSSLSPAGTNSIQSRSTDTLAADYLEPYPSRVVASHVARLSTNMRLSSFGSGGPLSPASPGSPNSYTNILEITNLNQAPQPTTHGNIYQEYPSSSIHLQKATKHFSLDVAPAELAPVANQLKITKNDPSLNVYMNAVVGNPKIIEEEEKPAPRATLAQMESLELDPEVSSPDATKLTATYMNVALGDEITNRTPPAFEGVNDNVTTPPVLTANLNSKMNEIHKDYTKNVGNSDIFAFNRTISFSPDSARCYENLDIGLAEMKPLMLRNRYSRPEIFSKVDLPLIDRIDKSEPCTPTQRKVNYIVLDLDQTQQTTINNNNNNLINNNLNINGSDISSENPIQSQMVTSISLHNGLLPPESPKKLGYATIDFNRSTALSNILSNNQIVDFDQSCRKTRHDSNAPALMTMKHSSSISD